MTLMRPPNAMPFSCRERAGRELQKTNDLAREAVSCNGLFGRRARSGDVFLRCNTTFVLPHCVLSGVYAFATTQLSIRSGVDSSGTALRSIASMATQMHGRTHDLSATNHLSGRSQRLRPVSSAYAHGCRSGGSLPIAARHAHTCSPWALT